jgi:cation diffusion facilitator CzcD-associated flavoprotein CzcO
VQDYQERKHIVMQILATTTWNNCGKFHQRSLWTYPVHDGTTGNEPAKELSIATGRIDQATVSPQQELQRFRAYLHLKSPCDQS